jgi:hypothetical protein
MSDSDRALNRRAFLGQMSLSMGGVAVATLAPISLLEAAPMCAVSAELADPCGDWTVDDMCMAYPPYAFAVPPAPAHTQPMTTGVSDIDRYWVM